MRSKEEKAGEEIVIAKAGKPMARLVPCSTRRAARQPGVWRGKVKIADDFDALPEEISTAFSVPRGEKTALIVHAIEQTVGGLRIADIQHQCPGVSIDMIKRVLRSLRTAGRVECLGRGQDAQWRKAESGNVTPNGQRNG